MIVGVNRYEEDESEPIELYRLDPAAEQRQLERTARVRAERDPDKAGAALAEVRRVAEGDENLLPPMREALRLGCTVGEISNELRDVFGTYDSQHSPRKCASCSSRRCTRGRTTPISARSSLRSSARSPTVGTRSSARCSTRARAASVVTSDSRRRRRRWRGVSARMSSMRTSSSRPGSPPPSPRARRSSSPPTGATSATSAPTPESRPPRASSSGAPPR